MLDKMSQSGKDKELKLDTESEEKETAQSEPKPGDDVKSSSTTSSSSNEEDEKKCMDAVDFLARQAKGIVIKKQGTETGKGKAPAIAAAGKRRKRASGGIKRSISLRSGLNELGYSFSSDDEPAEGKGNEKETDVFSDSGTDTEEACKRMKKSRNSDDGSDDNDGGADGAGTGAGGRADLSIQV